MCSLVFAVDSGICICDCFGICVGHDMDVDVDGDVNVTKSPTLSCRQSKRAVTNHAQPPQLPLTRTLITGASLTTSPCQCTTPIGLPAPRV